jgi:MFS family permease
MAHFGQQFHLFGRINQANLYRFYVFLLYLTLRCWAPGSERSRLVGLASSGAWVGNIIALPLGSYLCMHGFDGGWPSIFYIFGNSDFLVKAALQNVVIIQISKQFLIQRRCLLDMVCCLLFVNIR